MARTMRRRKSALHRLMDLLAKRDHGRREIIKKLSRYHEPAEVSDALATAEENQWLKPEDQVSQQFANEFSRKRKGINYINAKLAEKGLPRVKVQPELELEKALSLVENKFDIAAMRDEASDRLALEKEKARVGRFLVSRGFDSAVVRKVLYEKFRSS